MRSLEVLMSVVPAIYLLWTVTGRRRRLAVRMLPSCALALITVHAAVEGMRWQMVPLYIFAIAMFLTSLPAIIRARSGPSIQRPLRILLSLLLLAVSTAFPALLPVPSIPAPSGLYQVGTRIYELTDAARTEICSGNDEARRFQIQVWYPSEADPSDERAPWMSHAEIFAPAIATYIDMPPFFLNHLALVKIPAYQESKVAPTDRGYPVILFSHGWNGFNGQNTGQALQLASHGYVAIGVQHTYGAVVTVFNDGTIAKNNPSALPIGAPDDEYDAAAHKLANQWAADMGFALDFMQIQNRDVKSPFYHSLDLALIGAYGHSTGGGAAIQFCGTDPRCKALLGMDPFMRPVSYEVLANGVTQPSSFMFSQRWADDVDSHNNQLFKRFIPNVEESFGVITIAGTAHYDFTDLPLLSPLAPTLGLKGPINGKYVTAIVDDYLLSFFDAALKGESRYLFESQDQKYAEVKFSR